MIYLGLAALVLLVVGLLAFAIVSAQRDDRAFRDAWRRAHGRGPVELTREPDLP